MPVFKRTKHFYTCFFKCGNKSLEFSSMEQHEKICFCNPESKACRTCKNLELGENEERYISCEKVGLFCNFGNKNEVFSIETNSITWNRIAPKDLFEYEERPFPKRNCELYEQSEKRF